MMKLNNKHNINIIYFGHGLRKGEGRLQIKCGVSLRCLAEQDYFIMS